MFEHQQQQQHQQQHHHQQQQRQQQQRQEQDKQLTNSCEDVTSGTPCHSDDDTLEDDIVGEKLVLVRCNDSVTEGSTADIEDDVDDGTLGFGRKLRRKRVKRMKKKKKPLFRSDFVGNSSSSDEDEVAKNNKTVASIQNQNPAELGWVMWLWYYVVIASVSVFHGAEFCGEKLADFFGFTSPKHQYAINEYHRMKAEGKEEEEGDRREAESVRQRYLNKLSNIEMTTPSLLQQQQQQQKQPQPQVFFQPCRNHTMEES